MFPPYERIYRRAAQDGSDCLVIVTVVCDRRRLGFRDRTTAAALPWRRDHVGATVVLYDGGRRPRGEWFLIIYYDIKIIGPCWHKWCVQAAWYTRTKYGGGIFWRPSVNRVAAVVMVPWTHNRNSWPEILRSANSLSTAVYPSTVVLRYRHVCGTTHDCYGYPYAVRATFPILLSGPHCREQSFWRQRCRDGHRLCA